MNATSASRTDAPRATPQSTRRVVDAPTRAFHWLFALSFFGAYVTGETERWRLVHVTLGYTLAGLLGFRLVWGLVGPRHARLSMWVARLRSLPTTLRTWTRNPFDLGLLRPALGAAAVMAVLGLAVATTASGWGLYHEVLGGVLDDALEEVHEAMGNGMLLVVLAHVALVLGASWLGGQQQVRAMVSGRIRGRGPDLAKHNHPLLALVLLVAVAGFWGWQLQQAPSGGADLSGSDPVGFAGRTHPQEHDDED